MVQSFVNTFNKGMTSDISVIYQPDGTYRFMKNCTLISEDGNNFTIKDCMGNVKVFVINTIFDAVYTVYDTPPSPIGFISFPDKLVVFSTNNATETGGYGQIGLIKYFPYGGGVQPVVVANNQNAGYVPLYHHADLNFTKLRQIEGFGFEENESIQRIYWTDNLNPPRTLNVADPKLTTYIASGDIVSGTKYMVVEGAITYNAVNYGPGLTAGNIFTGTATTTYTTLVNTRIIEYIPVELLDFNPSTKLGNIKFNSYGSGSVYCGAKIYFYRLKSISSNSTSNWSYGSAPIHVGTENSLTAVANGTYFDFVGGGTTTTLLDSGFSVKIDISDIDTGFDIIEVACAEYDQTFNIPRLISIIESTAITGEDMTIEHTGVINLGELTVNDLSLFPISIVTCKTLSTNKNYLMAGNIRESSEYEFDKSTVSASTYEYLLPTHFFNSGAAPSCPNVMEYEDVGPDPNNNPVAADMYSGTKWIVSGATQPSEGGGIANSVEYPAGTYFYNGDVVTGDNASAVTFNGTAALRPCVSVPKYNPVNNTRQRNNYTQIRESTGSQKAYWNLKHPAVASSVVGHWPNEKYRYAIVFFDKFRKPSYARHLTDYTFEDGNTNLSSVNDESGLTDILSLKSYGIQFDDIRLSKELVDNISGFSIVRAERDKRIMTQGILMQIGSDGSSPPSYYPSCTPIVNDMLNNTNLANSYYFLCPDFNSSFPTIQVTSEIFQYIEEAQFVSYDPASNSAYNFDSKTESNQLETKYLSPYSDANTIVPKRITYVTSLNEAEDISGPFGDNATFENDARVGTGPVTIDVTCTTTGPTTTDLALSVARGCKKILLRIDSSSPLLDANTEGTTDIDYYDLANVSNAKAIVNIVVDKPNQYGGDSETALANTLYIQCGHYQEINSEVIADNFVKDGGGGSVTDYTYLQFNEVVVFGGDAYTNLIDIGVSLYDDSLTPIPTSPYDFHSWGIKFPCMSNSNYDLRRGRTVSNNEMHAQTNGVVYFESLAATQIRLEGFSYNQGYSSEGALFTYPALPVNYTFTDVFRTRIRFAGPKINSESIDSFRTFLSNDYKDMDGIGGEINNIRTKDGRTVVWQNAMISTVPINERQVVSGLDGAETTIGTGGVLDRFDTINSYFGNQHQWGLTQTEFGYVWFDMRRKAFVALDFSSGITEISQVEGLKGFFDEAFNLESTSGTDFNDYINSPTFNKESDRPLTGVGITGVYDPKFKTTYLTFKFKQETFVNPTATIINKDFTIGYYHPTRMFIGFFDWTPGIAYNHSQMVISSNNPKNPTKYYGPDMGIVNFVVGDIIGDGVSTYVCIADVQVSPYVTPPDPTYFAKTTDTSELWVHNQPITFGGAAVTTLPIYQYNKFFGIVVDNEQTFVVNPKTENPFAVLRIEQEGNNINFTDIYTSAATQSASDTSITSTNRWYRVIWDKICSSLPLSSSGRIVDSYLLVRWVKKNWTTDRRTLTGSVKILRNVKSFFTEKR